MKNILLIIFTVFVSFSSFALSTNAALDSATSSYKRGDYEKSDIRKRAESVYCRRSDYKGMRLVGN